MNPRYEVQVWDDIVTWTYRFAIKDKKTGEVSEKKINKHLAHDIMVRLQVYNGLQELVYGRLKEFMREWWACPE